MKERDQTWVVQKYGGTSLGKLLDTITVNIIPESLKKDRVAIVCSARSDTRKSEGTTKLLLEAISCAKTNGTTSTEMLDGVIDLIRDEHLRAVEVTYGAKREDVQDYHLRAIIESCEQLRTFLHAAQTVGELSPRSQDRVLAVGEKLACHITASFLESMGTSAEVVLLSDIVEQAYAGTPSEIELSYEKLGTHFFDAVASQIGERILACGDRVPVITGFFGSMPYSLLQSVGHGYSDLCAAMCAVGVGARELQIWKEVDGIFTADPTKIPTARLLPTVTPEEVVELTYFGSEVIHPFTIDHIRTANIPLRLKNVHNPSGHGTIVYPSSSLPILPLSQVPTKFQRSPPHSCTSTPPSTVMISNGYDGSLNRRRTPTALTVKDSVVIVNVLSYRNKRSHRFLAQMFEILDRWRVVVDLITTTEKSVSLAVASSVGEMKAVREAVGELEKLGKVSIVEGLSIISVVGHKMKNMVGIAGEIFTSLAGVKINIYLISQGASEINISFVIKNSDALLAMNVVHAQILKVPTNSEKENRFSAGPWLY